MGETGDALVSHPDVRVISFTGSTDTGLKVYQKAAGIGKKVGTEQQEQDLGVGFLGLATLLMLGSTGLSLRWFRRAI